MTASLSLDYRDPKPKSVIA